MSLNIKNKELTKNLCFMETTHLGLEGVTLKNILIIQINKKHSWHKTRDSSMKNICSQWDAALRIIV